MDELTIITNNVPRDIVYGYELSHDERKEFDYLHWREEQDDGYYHQFFRYKGEVYDLEDFEILRDSRFPGWQACIHDSFFSGVLVRFDHENENFGNDRIIVGRYYT